MLDSAYNSNIYLFLHLHRIPNILPLRVPRRRVRRPLLVHLVVPDVDHLVLLYVHEHLFIQGNE